MKTKYQRLWTTVLALVMMIGLAFPFRAAENTPYYDWKQHDTRWAGMMLTNRSMKAVGCLVTSVAMLAVQAGLKTETNFDPGTLAASLKRVGGFDWDNNLVWEKIPQAVQGLTVKDPWAALSGSQSEKTETLRRWLAEGWLVAVNVRGGGHWVALRGVSDQTVTIMDPACDATSLFVKYAASGITRAALLRAAVPAVPQTTQSTPDIPDSTLPQDDFTALLEIFTGLMADWNTPGMLDSLTQFFTDLFGLFRSVLRVAV
jgi:hypothetical protein